MFTVMGSVEVEINFICLFNKSHPKIPCQKKHAPLVPNVAVSVKGYIEVMHPNYAFNSTENNL